MSDKFSIKMLFGLLKCRAQWYPLGAPLEGSGCQHRLTAPPRGLLGNRCVNGGFP
jgi:hypothetical protein